MNKKNKQLSDVEAWRLAMATQNMDGAKPDEEFIKEVVEPNISGELKDEDVVKKIIELAEKKFGTKIG